MIKEAVSVNDINQGNVLVDFYTQTCAPCRALNPILEEISNEFQGIKVAKVDVVNNPEISQSFGISSVPTVIFMKDCQVKKIVRGLSNKETLMSMVRKCMSE
jgi:thioredoxin 1